MKSETPRLLEYKPFTASVHRIDTQSLKYQLKNQIQDLEEFSKEKQQIETKLMEKQRKLAEQEATFAQLESFSFYALKLANYMYVQLRTQQSQISALQTDLDFAKYCIQANELCNQSIMALAVQMQPNLAVQKKSYRRRLGIVKAFLIFAVRVRRSGQAFHGKIVVDRLWVERSAKQTLGVQDILQLKYSQEGSFALQSILPVNAASRKSRYLFDAQRLSRALTDVFSSNIRQKYQAEEENARLRRELDVVSSRTEFLVYKQAQMEAQAREYSEVVYLYRFYQLHSENIMLQQELHRIKLEDAAKSEENERLHLRIINLQAIIDRQQEFALQNQQYARRQLELEDEVRKCRGTAERWAQASNFQLQETMEVGKINHKQKIRALSAEDAGKEAENEQAEQLEDIKRRLAQRLGNSYRKRLNGYYLGK